MCVRLVSLLLLSVLHPTPSYTEEAQSHPTPSYTEEAPSHPTPRPAPSKLGFDEVYMINLERRPERRNRMLALLDMIGIDVRVFNAVDGRKLDDEKLKEMNVGGFSYGAGFVNYFEN